MAMPTPSGGAGAAAATERCEKAVLLVSSDPKGHHSPRDGVAVEVVPRRGDPAVALSSWLPSRLIRRGLCPLRTVHETAADAAEIVGEASLLIRHVDGHASAPARPALRHGGVLIELVGSRAARNGWRSAAASPDAGRVVPIHFFCPRAPRACRVPEEHMEVLVRMAEAYLHPYLNMAHALVS
jgi:hypothetical protein